MRIGPLYLWSRTNIPGSRIIAWHSPRSITWRWSLLFSWDAGTRILARFAPYPHKDGLQWWLKLWPVRVNFFQQRSMWRDGEIRGRACGAQDREQG